MREWLKKIRLENNLTQEELADQIQVARTTYAMYEQGERTPSVARAKKIADQLGFDWVLFFTDPLHETCS